MSTANVPLTKAVLRSLLWEGGAGAAARPDTETRPVATPETLSPALPAAHTHAPPHSPAPQREIALDDLTLAKIRLLELRRPPASALARVARNPIPWVVAALLVGTVLGRSKVARAGLAAGLAWAGKRVVSTTLKVGANRFASSRKPTGNGRFTRWMSRLS